MLEWGQGSSYAIYSIRLLEPEKRLEFLDSMRKEGVQGDTVLSYVVPDLDCYSSLGYKGTDFPNSLAWSQSVVNLPNHPTMSDEQIKRTINAVKRGMREIYA
jgi:dTDP-4-amino-4,6-dideoxygalactose transaminase